MNMMKRRLLIATLICVPLTLTIAASHAEAKPQWEKQWYPIQDGRENKLFVRFGAENGLRLRQWGNGYDTKVDFVATISYRGVSQGGGQAMNVTMEKVSLEAGATSEDGIKYVAANAEVLDITAVIK